MKDPSTPGLPPGGGTKIAVAVFFGLAGLGLGIYAFAIRGNAVNDSASTAVTIVGIVLPLLFIAGAYALLRMVFPPRARGITVTVPVTDVRRGSELEARLEIANPDTTGLELGLVCTEYYDIETTDGRGNRSRSTSQAVAHEDWRPQSGGPMQSVRFRIPEDAPFSYRGDCISYVWRVSARQPKRLRFDRAVNVPLDEPAGGSFRPGEWVRGRVAVLEGGGSRALIVSVHFRERTRDYSATAASYGGTPVHEGDLTAGASFNFAIDLPPDALPSHSSANGELFYEIEVKSDERGLDTRVQQRIEVASASTARV
jgi:hypothetical protein